jgi:hypothetical protein
MDRSKTMAPLASLLACGILLQCSVRPSADSLLVQFYPAHIAANPFLSDGRFDVAPSDCTGGLDSKVMEYSYLKSVPMKFTVVKDVALELELENTRASLRKIFSPYDGERIGVSVRLDLPPEDLAKANAFRRKFVECPILIVIDGRVEYVEPRLTNWNSDIPGGAFHTMRDAREFYERPNVTIAEIESDLEVVEAEGEFWRWKRSHGLWLFHCDEAIRDRMKREASESFEFLIAHPELFENVSCSEEPKAPRPGLNGDVVE